MATHKLNIHQATAAALYNQRTLYLVQPLIEAKLLLTVEGDIWRHLQVLSHCCEQWPANQEASQVFLQALGEHLEEKNKQEWLVKTLCQSGPQQQAVCDALCWQPQLLATAVLVDLYQHQAELRPLLFDLWRHRRDQIPAGLTSAAELRGQNIDLQTAALRYGASRRDIGHELFIPYFRDLNSAGARQIPGKLLATALWGSLLRGTGQLYEPLWRGIETETDAKSLYRLLRIGALIATPELPGVIRQYAKKYPAAAAELLALHGTREAIDTLAELTPSPAVEADFQAAWLWVSGKYLHIEPRLQIVDKQHQSTSLRAQDWWQQQRDNMASEQRLLFGGPLSVERMKSLAGQWAGRYSLNLLDLLAYMQKEPVTATERVPLRQRQVLLAKQGSGQ